MHPDEKSFFNQKENPEKVEIPIAITEKPVDIYALSFEERMELKMKEEEERERKTEEENKKIFSRLMAYNKEDMVYFYLGCLFSLGNGIIFPLFATFLANMISILA